MIFDFAFYLTLIVVITGSVTLFAWVFKKQLTPEQGQMPWWIHHSQNFFPVLLIVWLIRSFLFQPFYVPTGSLEPTVFPGDLILASKFSYGLRDPVFNRQLIPVAKPKRGQIMVFRWPVDPHRDFVKRVIGVPGDRIQYADKKLTINGEPVNLTFLGPGVDLEKGRHRLVEQYLEDLPGKSHRVFLNPNKHQWSTIDVIVPENSYFVMGDNRDDSGDSRQWGFVPEKNLLGRALVVWLSWDSEHHRLRWHRIGNLLV